MREDEEAWKKKSKSRNIFSHILNLDLIIYPYYLSIYLSAINGKR